MALTYQEKINLISGYAPIQVDLEDYMHIGASQFAINFMDTQKVIDTANQDAYSYLQKIQQLSTTVVNLEANNKKFLLTSFARAFIMIMLSQFPGLTMNQVQTTTPAEFETFIDGAIQTVFERIAGVMKVEKQAYDAAV